MSSHEFSKKESNKKVVTITLNPALDLTGQLADSLNMGGVSLVSQSTLEPAGKGVNVAKVLSDLGAQVTVTGFLGQDNQSSYQQLFEQNNIKDCFVRVAGSTRINVKLVDQASKVSDINFPGIEVDLAAIETFEKTLADLAQDHEYFVIAGSLPKGVGAEKCASWIEWLHQQGKKVVFDSSRQVLVEGINAKPWLIKPNDEELAELVNSSINNSEDCQQAVKQLDSKKIENIVISMGSEGVLWFNQGFNQSSNQGLTQNKCLQSKPPKMDVVSTVGAGDTLVAGLVWGHLQADWNSPQILTFATALSALAVTQVGVGVSDLSEVEKIQSQVAVNLL